MTEEEIKALQDKVTELEQANERIIKNRDDILGEKKAIQSTVAEQSQIAEDARQAAIKAEEARLISEGKTDELKAHYESQLAESTAKLNERAEVAEGLLKSRDYEVEKSNLMGMFHSAHTVAGNALLSQGLEVGYNENKQPVPVFKMGGEVVATGAEEIKSWALESPVFKQYLNGVDSSGAGASQSKAGSFASGNDVQDRLAQRLKAQGL